ncbi:unnamed protein product [Hyaloperonospora brassicae]|uniref:PUL domain-containing protein n=1 Tax=Hyaloperonospora brassicae TaxID=162125 RepID=A0AAV0TJX1_HYABA|nr:unnamed protein product [Hyaloperonospora brassicae]
MKHATLTSYVKQLQTWLEWDVTQGDDGPAKQLAQCTGCASEVQSCKRWVQGDAFFVLGWMVVIADEAMLTTIAALLPTVVKCLHRNVKLPSNVKRGADGEDAMGGRVAQQARATAPLSEKESNLRVYALVLLLNFSQRRVEVFEAQLGRLLPMLKDLVMELLEPTPPRATTNESSTTSSTSVVSTLEYAEVLRLVITLLSMLVDQLGSAACLLLELRILPNLLKLKRVLDAAALRELLGERESQDVEERLEAVVETLVHCR